jgi:hypothetical protein
VNNGLGNISGRTGYLYLQEALTNRYNPSRWKIWARAVSPIIPIVQSNAIVESLWTTLKRKYLLTQRRPKLELLVDIIMNQHMAYLAKMINQHRNLEDPLKPNWYRTLRLLLIIGITVLLQNISSIAKRRRKSIRRTVTKSSWRGSTCTKPRRRSGGALV